MKIKRDGNEYELTSEELLSAYEEKQHLYDKEDIRDTLETLFYLKKEEKNQLMENEEFINNAAYAFRININEGWEYENALDRAIKETIKNYLP